MNMFINTECGVSNTNLAPLDSGALLYRFYDHLYNTNIEEYLLLV